MFEWIYILYVVISSVILRVFFRLSLRDWLLRVIMVSVFPVAGWLFPVFWKRLFRKKHFRSGQKMVEMLEEQVAFKDLRDLLYSPIEAKRDLNVLPIEEALVVSDYAERRRVMLDVLQHDAHKHIDVLQKAVSNEDSETSHYAVSALMEAKSDLMHSMQQLSVQFEENNGDIDVLHTYADVLRSYMRSGFLDEKSLRKYKYTYLEVLKQLIEVTPNAEYAYTEAVHTQLELDQRVEAERTARLFLERFPKNEQAYLLLMKVYYCVKSSKKIQETLKLLKQSPIRLSHDGLKQVRFWSEGAVYEK